MPWYSLTDEETARLNPPDDVLDDVAFDERWQPVGAVPRPRTRLGWFFYHLAHGLLMRYPLHKVLGFALANTRPEVVDVDLDEAGRSPLSLALEIECSSAEFLAYQRAIDSGASVSDALLAALSASVLDGIDWTGVDICESSTSNE